ncbi:DUF488 domain-containing protein [Corallococcus exiguus]|nr:DUF488 domain-containing protein [Corallococcus exiguus]
MLFDRQRQLLGLLGALGGRVGDIDFQKLLFLYCQETSGPAAYEFVPYKFGAFSFTSHADRRKLIERELLSDEENHWQLTDEGKRMVRGARELNIQFAAFVRRHQSLSGESLIAESYRRYPYYATRSEIAERVLQGDAVALKRIRAAQSVQTGAPLATIGYEGRTLESYLNELLMWGCTVLCDVRRNPVSRKYGFSKSALSNGCVGVGILYVHLPELGIASEFRQSLDSQEDYDALFDQYERESLPLQQHTLEAIGDWLRAGERVALTCYENLPNQCHRHCVAEALENGLGKGFAPKHL